MLEPAERSVSFRSWAHHAELDFEFVLPAHLDDLRGLLIGQVWVAAKDDTDFIAGIAPKLALNFSKYKSFHRINVGSWHVRGIENVEPFAPFIERQKDLFQAKIVENFGIAILLDWQRLVFWIVEVGFCWDKEHERGRSENDSPRKSRGRK